MGKKIVGIILIIAGLVTGGLGIKALVDNPGDQAMLEEAVYVEDAKINPENEGKIVIVSGTVDVKGPIVDTATGVEVNALKLVRNKWKSASVRAENEGYNWSWVVDGAAKTFYPEATIGDFNLTEDILVSVGASTDLKEYDESKLKSAGYMTYKDEGVTYVVTDGVLISKTEGGFSYKQNDYKGASKYAYKYSPVEGELKYTFVGTQKDGKLVAVDGLGGIAATEGILDKAALIEKFEGETATGNIFTFVAAIALVAGGVVCLVIKKKEA